MSRATCDTCHRPVKETEANIVENTGEHEPALAHALLPWRSEHYIRLYTLPCVRPENACQRRSRNTNRHPGEGRRLSVVTVDHDGERAFCVVTFGAFRKVKCRRTFYV